MYVYERHLRQISNCIADVHDDYAHIVLSTMLVCEQDKTICACLRIGIFE